MKPLDKLTTIGKAELLHQLFPQEIPALITFIQNMGKTIKEEEKLNRQIWNKEPFSFDEWIQLADEVNNRIYQHGTKLYADKRLFAIYLFYDDVFAFTSYCISVYITTRIHNNQKFKEAIELLFNP